MEQQLIESVEEEVESVGPGVVLLPNSYKPLDYSSSHSSCGRVHCGFPCYRIPYLCWPSPCGERPGANTSASRTASLAAGDVATSKAPSTA
ncbi:hypothetical protein LguiA_035898 [Lonicera macranthoides]